VFALATPLLASPLTESDKTLSWESRVQHEVDNIIKSHGAVRAVDGEQADVQLATSSEWTIPASLPDGHERPRPPKLEDTISNLRALMDHIEMENINSVANQDAVGSSYASKRALVESMIAGPQQAVIARTEQRQLCDREVKALSELDGIVGKAIERSREIAVMRGQQASSYVDMTNTIKQLTQKNIITLQEVTRLLKEEIETEKSLNGGVQFDPVSLRQQPPENMLRHADELTGGLLALMNEKLGHQEIALDKIKRAFACPECEEANKKLGDAAAVVQSDLRTARERCAVLAESHRALDEADREKVIALKQDLEDIEAAEKVHQAAEQTLSEERKQSQHVAQTMIGFYQSLPAKKGGIIA